MQVVVTGTTSQGIAAGTYYIIGSPTSTSIQLSSTRGGSGITTTVGSITGLTFTLSVLNVSAVSSGTIAVGMLLSGTSVTTGAYITSIASGSGGVGQYNINRGTTGTVTTGTRYTVNNSQNVSSAVTITGTTYSETYDFTIQQSQVGNPSLTSTRTVQFTVSQNATRDAQAFLAAFSAAVSDPHISASLNTTTNIITISHSAGGEIKFVDGTGNPLSKIFTVNDDGTGTANYYTSANGLSDNYIATLWTAVVNGSSIAPASLTAPTSTPVDGTLWYNTDIGDVDIMINDGSKWVGYLNYTQNQAGGPTTDPMGPIVLSLIHI